MMEEGITRDGLAEEKAVREKVDDEGNKWKKVYFGGGDHFRNWLGQYQELGFELEMEEVDPTRSKRFEPWGEKIYRIWVRD